MNSEWQNAPWKDLETKGYLVIRGGFDTHDIQEFLNEYKHHAQLQTDPNYNIVYMRSAFFEQFQNKFTNEILPWIHSNTDIKADMLEQGGFYATSKGVNFDWHIDPDSYYISRDLYNYLNFYSPIIKPDPTKSNLTIIPSDILAKRAPHIYEKVVKGRGALRLLPGNGKSVIVDDNDGQIYECDFNADEMAITPHLDVGDILIMRGDLLHKTQDNSTNRVNISLRVVNSQQTVRLNHFDATCLRKTLIMAGNHNVYRLRKMTFEQAGKESMSLLEHNNRFNELMRNPPPENGLDPRIEFLTNLGEVLKNMPSVKVVVIEDCSNYPYVQGIFNVSNSLGAHLLVANEKVQGLLSKVKTDRALHTIFVKDTRHILKQLRSSGLNLIGLDSTMKETFADLQTNTHTVLVVNGDTGVLSRQARELCHRTVSVPIAYGRVMPLSPSGSVAYVLTQMK